MVDVWVVVVCVGLVGVWRQCGVVVGGCWWMVLDGCWAGLSWWMVLVGDGRAGVVSWCWLGRCWSVAIVGLGVFSSANGASAGLSRHIRQL